MHRILLLFAFFGTVLTENDNQQFVKCSEIIKQSTSSCCLTNNMYQYMNVADVRECLKISQTLNSCDRDICIANKVGIASSDGIIDKNELLNHIIDDFEGDIELKNAIIDACVEGDLDKFGTEDICEAKKLKLCIDLQIFTICRNWDTKGLCAGVQELAEECVEFYS